MSCPAGQGYDLPTHSCLPVALYSNLGPNNWASTDPAAVKLKADEISRQTGAKQCPIETPFFNGSSCVSCPDKNGFFSFDGMKCSTCSSDTIFNPNMHACVSPNLNFQTNPLTAPNLIYGGKSKN